MGKSSSKYLLCLERYVLHGFVHFTQWKRHSCPFSSILDLECIVTGFLNVLQHSFLLKSVIAYIYTVFIFNFFDSSDKTDVINFCSAESTSPARHSGKPVRPTAANLQQRVCCCEPMLGQTDGHCTATLLCIGYYVVSAYSTSSLQNAVSKKRLIWSVTRTYVATLRSHIMTILFFLSVSIQLLSSLIPLGERWIKPVQKL